MKNKNMTALTSCFCRAYHYRNSNYRIFSDEYAKKIISEKEYNDISYNMANGINFFNPNFIGSEEEALKWVVNNQLAPSILGRSIFCEKSLITSIKLGCKQYLSYASGYDTLAYKKIFNGIKIFELDKTAMIEDKIRRLKENSINYENIDFIKTNFTNVNWKESIIKSKYDSHKLSFNSLLGISYYLKKEDFSNMIASISTIICDGSSIIFDYPTYIQGEESKLNEKLASGASEVMKSKYSYEEIEKILSDNGLLIYEHLNYIEMTKKYFDIYNTLNPSNKIIAPKGVSYCLAVKKQNLTK